MKIIFATAILALFSSWAHAQERVVTVDFESGSFYNNPRIPFDEPFAIMGETGRDTEYVIVNIFYEGKSFILHSFVWNRIEKNTSETFKIVVPPILRSNTKYDFEVITYKLLTRPQKEELLRNVEDRVRFLLMNNIYFDGENVVVNKPKDVYNKLQHLASASFKYHESKNVIPIEAPSSLVLEELKKQNDFRFNRLFRRNKRIERDSIANKDISDKVDHIVSLISSELAPFVNSQLVQYQIKANIKSVETDKEPFSLPVNVGMYAWDKALSINNTSVHNINITPGAGLTIPFKGKSRLATRTRMFDSFGFSSGVLFQPVVDNTGTEFVTPGINLPVYTGLGFRIFNVVRFNAGVLLLGERGNQDFDNFTVIPTAGLALELNLWMGIKK